MTEEYYKRYRPVEWDQVYGQPQAVSVLKKMVERKSIPHVLLLVGASGCLRGDMPIYDPVDGSTKTVRERWKDATPFSVFSYDGNRVVVAAALPPVQYPSAPMFLVETDRQSFVVTSEHRFLLASGDYLSLKELSSRQFSEVPLLSTSGTCPEVQQQDESYYSRTAPSFPVDYQHDLHSCDEPLLLVSNTDQESFPSQDDALEQSQCAHSSFHGHRDGREHEREYNHLDLGSDLLSMLDFLLPDFLYHDSLRLIDEENHAHGLHSIPILLQSPSSTCQKGTSFSQDDPAWESTRAFSDANLSLLDTPVKETTQFSVSYIQKITELPQEMYYDFHVPIYNNYWMNGCFHHNCGKTTCARILKEEMKCHDRDFIEKDFGEAGGVAAARAIIERLSSAPVGKCRIYYLDEVHRASNDAQTALLKTFEDTPKHVYFILSTTHPQKLLKTIKTRATEIVFNEMSDGAILQAIDDVVKAEKIKLGGDVQAALINAAQGSARKALVLLDQIANLPANEQLKAIHGADSEVQAIDICRALLGKGTRWSDMAKLLKGISNDQAENLRWAILGYARNVLLNGANPKAHQIIYEFSNNFFNTGSAGLVWACYAIIQGK